MPTMRETIETYRTFANQAPTGDTHDMTGISPHLVAMGHAEIAYETVPFTNLIKAIDGFFGNDLDDAFTGPEADAATTAAQRIIAEHVTAAGNRLTRNSTPPADWATARHYHLQQIAAIALQRAADLRFVNIVTDTLARIP